MLGLSVSLYRGGAEGSGTQIVTLGDGFVGSLSGSSRIPVEGTSVGMGALYDFQSRGGPPVRLGFKFVPGFDLSGRIDTDLAIRIDDSQGIVIEETTPADYDYVLDFPLDLGIGLAWSPRRDLLIAADFEHRRFRDSALRVFGAPDVNADEDGNLTIQRVDEVNILSDSGADLNQWRVGFEWSWVNELTVIPIRVGAKNLPQVSAHQRSFVDPEDGEITTSFDNQVVGTALTAGVGFVTDAFVFDVGIEYGRWRQEVFRIDSEGTDFQESKTRRLALKMSLVVYF